MGKLVKFIILSRVSKGGLIALVGFTVYLTVIDLVLFEGVTHSYLKVPLYLSLGYTVAVYALFSFIFSSLGGFVITKADVDYLFTLPIDRKTLGTALFLSYLVISALLMAFLASLTYNVYLTAVSPLLGTPEGRNRDAVGRT